MAEDRSEEIALLRADNDRLRRLLDQANTPAELRHRMRSTLALLRHVIRRSADRATDIEDYVAHLVDRVDAVARAQTTADDQGTIDLHTLLAEELIRFRIMEDERLQMSGPSVQFHARPGQAIALAIHELALNAIQHGPLGLDEGRLTVTWHVEGKLPDRALIFEWRETGLTPPAVASAPGFGTDTLSGMIPHELGATTTFTYDEAGLSCVIRMPWAERLGSIL
jgi:YD repeat-containing protein